MLSQIRGFNSQSLKKVDTQITTVEGRKFTERREDGVPVLTELNEGSVALGYCPDYAADMTVGVAMDSLLVSSQDVASDRARLKELGITHILNVAYGIPNSFPEEFVYLTEEMFDDQQECLLTHYQKCEAFIDVAREAKGTVLVHCNAGCSRSVSIALAYVLHKRKVPLHEALDELRQTRPTAQPNQNFMEQLRKLEKVLIQT